MRTPRIHLVRLVSAGLVPLGLALAGPAGIGAAPAGAADAEHAATMNAPQGKLRVPYTLHRLPNGLTVILHEDHSIPRVSVNTWYHVGSSREKPGRTGFAHLFEHLMFEGSAHVPEGAFDNWLEAVGGENNGSTAEDRTNYWEDVPSNALELPLFLESDRMGFLLDNMTPDVVDGQRDVVKNERRQSYENRPYGMADLVIWEALYPPGHPYSWPVIGSMEDLTAASYDDVKDFFRRYYGPGNASIAIAGDINPDQALAAVTKWFSDVVPRDPVPPLEVPAVDLREEKHLLLEDHVQIPKLVVAWPSARAFDPGDAALTVLADVLGRGKNSRLYRTLVYEMEIAQDVAVYQYGMHYAGLFGMEITARPGHGLAEILKVVDRQIALLQDQGVETRELERSVNGIEAQFLDAMERVGGFGGKADQLNYYWFYTGDPDYFEEDLSRFKALSASDIEMAAERWLGPGRVLISVVPEGRQDLAARGAAKGKETKS